jgi:hypothetical protein
MFVEDTLTYKGEKNVGEALTYKSEKNVNFLEAFREEVYKRKGPSLDHALAVGFFLDTAGWLWLFEFGQ